MNLFQSKTHKFYIHIAESLTGQIVDYECSALSKTCIATIPPQTSENITEEGAKRIQELEERCEALSSR